MNRITRRSMMLGSVAVTVSASGLVLSVSEAEALSLKGIVSSIGHIGAAVAHGVSAVAHEAGHILQVAPSLINDAAQAAAQVIGAVAPTVTQLAGLEQQVVQFGAGQLLQQIPIFCNQNANLNPLTIISGISNIPAELGGIAQQAIMANPTSYLQDNAQDLVQHLAKYLLEGSPTRVSIPGAAASDTGMVPSFMPTGIPFIGNQSNNGIFPTLLGLNSFSTAVGGPGLLSLFALL